MQLNSILFPAPRCSYSPEQLNGELIWVPKYRKTQFPLTRFSTIQADTKGFYSQPSSSHHVLQDSKKSNIPHVRSKKTMPKAGTTISESSHNHPANTKGRMSKISQLDKLNVDSHRSEPRVYHQGFGNPSFTRQSDSVSPDISVLDGSEIMEEGPTELKKLVNQNKKLLACNEDMVNIDDCDGYSEKYSENISITLDEIQIKRADNDIVNKNKRFIKKEHSQISKVTSKSTTHDVSMAQTEMTDAPPIAQEKKPNLQVLHSPNFNGISQSKQAVHKKKPSSSKIVTLNQPAKQLGREESKVSLDDEMYEEYPSTAKALSSPRNLPKYQTRTFANPSISFPLTKSFDFDSAFASVRSPKSNYLTASLAIPTTSSTVTSPANKMSVQGTLKPTETIEYHIPCMVLKSTLPTSKMLIYFHGNGEDIYLAYDLLSHIRNNLSIHVVAVEYPGYGLYKGAPSETQIQSDSEAVFDYFTSKLSIHPKDIIIFGRSIGSGPATWLASRKNIGALVLMSAFTSIRAVVRDLAGKWAQYLIKERFNNLEHISRVTCPTFLIHGLKDSLISYKQSQDLHNACKGPCELVLPKEMDHIEFDFYEDFTAPLAFFLARCNFQLRAKKGHKIEFPPHIFENPYKAKENLHIQAESLSNTKEFQKKQLVK